MSRHFDSLDGAINDSFYRLSVYGQEVDPGHWQGVDTTGRPDMVTKELVSLEFESHIPHTVEKAQQQCLPNLPWAEDHFQERVSRDPSNPGEQYKNWPWWTPDKEEYTYALETTRTEFEFTHTYQERFWARAAWDRTHGYIGGSSGIRYDYGDLNDVVKLLAEHPYTRQATFPIFFPEDTGAVHGGRIPCTLHYHFLLRDDRLHMWYPIRSCDAIRHFRDDIYMACRLNQWIIEQLTPLDPWVVVKPGLLNFTAYSFHYHKGDMHLLEQMR